MARQNKQNIMGESPSALDPGAKDSRGTLDLRKLPKVILDQKVLVDMAHYGSPELLAGLMCIVHRTCKNMGIEDKGTPIKAPGATSGKPPYQVHEVVRWLNAIEATPDRYRRAIGFLGNLNQTLRSRVPVSVVEQAEKEATALH